MFKYPHILSCLPCSIDVESFPELFINQQLLWNPNPVGVVFQWTHEALLLVYAYESGWEFMKYAAVLSTFLGHIKCNFQMQHLSVKALKEKSHLYLLYAVATQNFEVKVFFGIHISNVIMLFMVKTKLVLFKSDTTMKCWINDLSFDKMLDDESAN